MDEKKSSGPVSRREVLVGASLDAVATGSHAEQAPVPRPQRAPKFDVQRFIDDCRRANEDPADAQKAIQAVLEQAMADPQSVLVGVGEPRMGGIQTLYRSDALTILNIVWSPLMQLMPHEHRMWSVIGIYTGREDNIFWQRQGPALAAQKAIALSKGSVVALPHDVIHSVTNPIEKLTGAIHIYGGDFFAVPRSEWDPETLSERDWSLEKAKRIFEQSNDRFSRQPRGCDGSAKPSTSDV